MNSKIYTDSNINLSYIKNKKIGIIGFGNQGKSQALNLIDSGLDVVVGLRNNSKSVKFLNQRNISFSNIPNLVLSSDIIVFLIPDSKMKKVYKEQINDNLTENQTLIFSHGYNIHYGHIKPPSFVNIGLVAPSGGGQLLRDLYKKNSGLPALLAVEQDYTGNTLEILKAYSKGIGSSRICSLLSTFKEETETDLYGEQVLLTGGIPMMIEKSLKVLLEGGYSPTVAWFVCYYEVKMIVDLFHTKGIEYLYNAISDTARYGGIKAGNFLIDDDYEDKLKKILNDIKSGSFKNDFEKNTDSLKYISSIDKTSQGDIKEIMKILFDKDKNS